MKRIAASLIVLAATSSAYALELDGEMYVVGSLVRVGMNQSANNSFFNGASITANGVTTSIANVQSTQSSSRSGFRLQLGYEFSPNFAVEGGYVDLGKTTDSSNYTTTTSGTWLGINYSGWPGPSGSVTRTSNISGWSVAGVGIYPLNEAFSLFAKLGMIDAQARSSISGSGPFATAATNGNSNYKLRPYFGIGATVYPNLDRDLGIRIEYEKYSKVGDTFNDTAKAADVNLMSLGVSSKF